MQKWKLAVIVICVAIAGGCSNTRQSPNTTQHSSAIRQNLSEETANPLKAYMVVESYEWGPAVKKVILEWEESQTEQNINDFQIMTKVGEEWEKREITASYICDVNGNKIAGQSNYIAIEMEVNSKISQPFAVDFNNYFKISWADNYEMRLENGQGNVWEYQFKEDDRIIPELEKFQTDQFTSEQNIVLNRAWYEPEEKTESDPLIIWLHGGGEGGEKIEDLPYALLGTEAVALAREDIQSYFKTGYKGGAWVLLAQTPTYWMDETGTRQENRYIQEGKQESFYTEALFASIEDFVNQHTEIDKNRIYIGGSSNGGYMTVNMMFEYGDFFAAYFPVCESYLNANISDEMVKSAVNKNVWFVHAENDTIVDPKISSIPLYYRMTAEGADNIHFTLMPDVKGTDDPSGEYMGHYSWVYVFNNQVKRDFELDKVDISHVEIAQSGEDKGNIISDNHYVTAANCVVEADMFEWMAQQRLKQ